MKLIKKNLKLIVGMLIGIPLVSGITAYATYQYYATEVSYTKDGRKMSVADALNELYEIKKDYIKPSGTLPITIKNDKINVSNYEYVDTTELYTIDEVESGKGINWEKKTVPYPTGNNYMLLDIGWIPSWIIIRATNNSGIKYHWFSDDSCKTFSVYDFGTKELRTSTGWEISGSKLKYTPGTPSGWTGVNFEIFAVK